MKNFSKFLEEVTIKNNPAIPGEAGKNPGDKNYLSDTERRAKTRLGLSGREDPRQIGGRMMQLLEQSLRMTRGKEDELEELAKKIILNNYGDILEGVELDIKLVRSGREIANFMEEEEEEEEEELPEFRKIKDKELISKIHKAKIGNTIIQGESKNTKHILNTEEVRDGLNEIFGDRGGEIFEMWNEISKLADKMDWIIPIDIKADMMENSPEGMAGASRVDWKPKESKKEPEKEDDDDDKEDDYMERILKEIEDGKNPDEEDLEKFHEDIDGTTPVIRARGIDFPMLLHETVKGIYELIAAVAAPAKDASEKDIKDAKTIKLNVSSFEDEAEDFRTGPEIAADFRDFINENPKSNESQNMRAFIFGKMMDPANFTADEFLKLFRGILNGTQEARTKVDEMIDEVSKQLSQYELGQVIDTNDDEVPGRAPSEHKSSSDYSSMSQSELLSLMDDKLDELGKAKSSSERDLIKKQMGDIGKYIKNNDSLSIYFKEIDIINEGISHTRRKNK